MAKKIYVVPKGEEAFFVSLLRKRLTYSIEPIVLGNVYLPSEGVLEGSSFMQFLTHVVSFNLDWNVVCSTLVVSNDLLEEHGFETEKYFEDDYYAKVASLMGTKVSAFECKKFTLQLNFTGYGFIYNYLFKKSVGAIDPMKRGGKQPEIYSFFELIATGSLRVIIDYYFKLIKRYGINDVSGSIYRFYERLVDYTTGENIQLSRFYTNIIENFLRRHDEKRILKTIALLAETNLSKELSFIYSFYYLDNALKIKK